MSITRKNPFVSIADIIRLINEMAEDGIIDQYAIGGAVGATFYLEPVATLDVDIFVAFRMEQGRTLISLHPIFDYLSEKGGRVEGEYMIISGWPVQFLPATGPLIEEGLRQSVTIDVEGAPARVFTAEHLAAIALQTGRAKDKARLLQFVEAGTLEFRKFEAILVRHDLMNRWREFKKTLLRKNQ
jgi:hypothetical protein